MRKRSVALVLLVTLWSGAALASASFANRNLGVGLGVFTMRSDTTPIDFAIPLYLEGGYYLDNNFDLYLRVPLAFCSVRGFDQKFAFGFGGEFGVRYLFSQESFRPWLGGHIAGLGLVSPVAGMASPFAGGGVGLSGGAEYFVGESVALGARVFFDVLFNFATTFSVQPTFGGALYVATYF